MNISREEVKVVDKEEGDRRQQWKEVDVNRGAGIKTTWKQKQQKGDMETEGGNRDPSEKSKQEIKCELQQISRERVGKKAAGTQAEDGEGDE